GRGAFDQAAAEASGRVLAAYAIGLPAIVVIRAVVTSFHARSDTTTPVIISFIAIALNIALKLLLWRSHGASGLALATAAGAWANALLLYVVAYKRGWTKPDRQLSLTMLGVVLASLAMAAVLILALPYAQTLVASLPHERKLAALVLAGFAGLGVYGVVAGPMVMLARRSRKSA
ncbi:MAG: lipid II flippase MurJ, partial [Bosea sp. (in: a-proteobacteria)]